MSLINDALKQARGASPLPVGDDSALGKPVYGGATAKRRSLRNDLLIVAAVLFLPLLVFALAAFVFVMKSCRRQVQPVSQTISTSALSAPAKAALSSPANLESRPPPVPEPVSMIAPNAAVTHAESSTRALPKGADSASSAPIVHPVPPRAESVLTAAGAVPASAATIAKVKVRFRLAGVMGVGADAKALINNRICRIGDTVEDARITDIGSDHVKLEVGGESVEMAISERTP
jgi:hypothetical protein